MNSFIPCGKNCLYQKDGQCTLENLFAVNNVNLISDCIYYKPKSNTISLECEKQKNTAVK